MKFQDFMHKRWVINTGKIGIILVCVASLGAVYHYKFGSGQAKSHVKVHRVVHKKVPKVNHKFLMKHNHIRRNNKRRAIKRQQRKNRPGQLKSNLKWQKGVPSELSNKSFWISNYRTLNKGKNEKYGKLITTLGKNNGYNSTPNYYNAKHKHTGNGSVDSITASAHPHYASLGGNYYLITSGSTAKNDRTALSNEVNNKNNKNFGNTVLVKINGINNINIWLYERNSTNNISINAYKNGKVQGKKQYLGNFSRYPFNVKVALRALGVNK